MIRTEKATLRYADHGREVFAVDQADVEVRENEFVGILGPSGSGKSSLLYILSGLKLPTSGRVMYQDTDLSNLPDAERSRVRLREFGFVFQQPFLLGYLTAMENVMLSAPPEREDARNHADELLEALGVWRKRTWLPHEMSVGERQRVCVARALVGYPKVIFADEPTASLDHRTGEQVVQLLNEHRGRGSLVMVTHDPSMLAAADRVLHISYGRIVREEASTAAGPD
ncbi:MAG: ABC transporter ATP-binding protein [Fimbriimonadaceae bacterium]